VSVTAVQEVKGLEFDHVIIPDGSSSVYPDSGEARRALYVAITRAVHHVLFATTGAWTSLVG
jgi:DNA helicase IV